MLKKAVFVIGVAVIFYLGWAVLDLAIENDGLRQSLSSHDDSIRKLLHFVKATSRCDLQPREVAEAMGISLREDATNAKRSEISFLAFKATFMGSSLNSVQVVGVDEVRPCDS